MRKQNRDLLEAVQSCALGALLLAVVFLAPDAGDMSHKNFFMVAIQSPWSQPLDWQGAWCAAKIIILSTSLLVILNALLGLVLNSEYQAVCVTLFMASIFPLLLGFFGFYELTKAIL